MSRKTRNHYIALVILSLILMTAAGEIIVRILLKRSLPSAGELREQSLQYEPTIFARHVFPQKEILAHGWANHRWPINEKGYRGPNFSSEKPEGVIRVMFYGGSQVFNRGASLDNDWPHRAGQILKERGISNIEIINAGIPGHASFDAVGRLLAEGHLFTPDYLILCNAWNDIKYFKWDEPLLRKFKPYEPTSDPRINYHNFLDKVLSEYLKLYRFFRTAYYKLKIGSENQKTKGELADHFNPKNLEQFRINVETFVDLARNIGATPVLMTQARLLTDDTPEHLRKRIHFEYQGLTLQALNKAFMDIDSVIKEIAKEKGVAFIDASGIMTGQDAYFEDHVHLTDRGSQKLAELTAAALYPIIFNK